MYQRYPSVVGYQNKSLKGGAVYNLSVATFKAVGKDADKMVLGDISASDDWMTGQDEVKTLKSNGAVDKAYTYVGAALAAEAKCLAGWYLTDDVNDDSKLATLSDYCKNSDPLPLGNGLLVLVGSSSTTLTYAGEVLAADQQISLKSSYAYNITGNVSPVDITLGDITASDDWMTGQDELKTLKDNGAVNQAYTYVSAETAASARCLAGWYLTDDVNDETKLATLSAYCKNKEPVEAGEAFIVLVGTATTTITIPSAL